MQKGATIGIELKINDPADSNVLWDAMDAGTHELWCAAWGATIDPDMYQVYHSSNIVGLGGSDSNHYHIQSATLDQLILEQFGVEVDYNIEIGLDAFETIIDTLGGVDMELSEEEAAYLNKIPESYRNYDDCTAGMNHLNGMAAQFYVRMRHATAADNDFNRTARQRKLFSAVIDKCRNMSVLEMHNLMTELLPSVLTDMSNEEILTCAAELLPYAADLSVVSQQIPAEGTYSSKIIEIYDVPSGVLVPNVEKNRQILTAICEESEESEATVG